MRFDVAYFSIFKCNRKRIADYPNLANYMRELYQVPGVAGTVKPRYYVINYYSIPKVNPTDDHSQGNAGRSPAAVPGAVVAAWRTPDAGLRQAQ